MYLSIVQTKGMSHTLEHDSFELALKSAEETANKFSSNEIKAIEILDLASPNWRCIASLRVLR